MNDVARGASTSGRRRGLIAVIASITTVGIMISAVAPLLSLNLEQRGVDTGWNGLLPRAWPLAGQAITTIGAGRLSPVKHNPAKATAVVAVSS